MNNLDFPVNSSSTEEFNLFLRAVWSRFRNEFGTCAWQFMPMNLKENKQTILGKMDIGVKNAIDVSTTYKIRGTIKELIFGNIDEIDTKNKMSQILSDGV